MVIEKFDINQPGQQIMTTHETNHLACPGEGVLKLMTGKWKPQILRLALQQGSIRFNSLLRQLPGSSKQSLAVALRELEEGVVLRRTVVQEKPLHVEYALTEKGKAMISIYKLASKLATA